MTEKPKPRVPKEDLEIMRATVARLQHAISDETQQRVIMEVAMEESDFKPFFIERLHIYRDGDPDYYSPGPNTDFLIIVVSTPATLTVYKDGQPLLKSAEPGGATLSMTHCLPVTFYPTEEGDGIFCSINGSKIIFNCMPPSEGEDYTEGMRQKVEAVIARNALIGITWQEEEPAPAGEEISAPAPLVQSNTRAKTMLQNPVMALLFAATGERKEITPFCDGERGGMSLQDRKNGSVLAVYNQEAVPLEIREAETESEMFRAWAASGVAGDLSLLDDKAWEIAALGVTAFFTRTKGDSIDTPFPFLWEDYYEWRDIDPRKRSTAENEELAQRLELLFDANRVSLFVREELYLPDPQTGRKTLTPIITKGSFFDTARPFWRAGQMRLGLTEVDRQPDGYRLRLGEWARQYVAARAMLGVNLKRLAEYDLRRQLWERRIGWYLCFFLQSSNYKAVTRPDNPNKKALKPAHGLHMETILDKAGLDWKPGATTNPGRVISQFLTALQTLKADGVIGEYACIDGEDDGSDLPIRGRLEAMLQRRWEFTPGADQRPHIVKRHKAKLAASKETRKRSEARRQKKGD